MSTLGDKYNEFVTGFIGRHAHEPFFLYMPFSHVHTTAANQPEKQYAGCAWKNTTRRGMFGDALKEVDWIVGNVVAKLEAEGIAENTLILLTGDNGKQSGRSGQEDRVRSWCFCSCRFCCSHLLH